MGVARNYCSRKNNLIMYESKCYLIKERKKKELVWRLFLFQVWGSLLKKFKHN